MKILLVCCTLLIGVFSSTQVLAVDRLFTTAKERQILDSRRYGRDQFQGDEKKVQAQSIHLNGVVTIDQQAPKIWLNGEPAQANGAQLEPDSNSEAVELFLPERNINVRLKPGQQIDLLTGRRLEPFNVPQKSEENTAAENENEPTESDELLDDDVGGSP